MIWQCVEDAELRATVDALAQQFAAAPTRGLAATKAAIRGSGEHSLAEQLDIERDAQRELGRSADYAEGVAAFIDKRAPQFHGALNVAALTPSTGRSGAAGASGGTGDVSVPIKRRSRSASRSSTSRPGECASP